MAGVKKHHAALDAMVLGEQRVVSYRTLSSELSIPTTESQQILCEYIKLRSEKLLATWAVTSEVDAVCRLSLVKGPPPSVEADVKAVSVWAIAPAALPNASDGEAWIEADRTRELAMVKTAPSQRNELRDNKWNRISSATAGWSVGGAAAQERERMEAISKEKHEVLKKKQSSGLLAKVKAEAADKRKKAGRGKNGAVTFSRPNSKNGGNGRPKTSDGSKPSSKALRTLGDSLVKKRRPSSEPSNGKSAAPKKGRRMVVEESDGEDESEEDEEDEETRERIAMEKEAAEAERKEAEREDVRKELEDLHDDGESDDDFMESLEAQIEDKKAKAKANSVRTPPAKKSNGKRELEDKADEQSEPAKKKKKYKAVVTEVMEETADGYIKTKRVTKYLDDDGNEKPEDEPLEVEKSSGDSKPFSAGSQNGEGSRKEGSRKDGSRKAGKETKKSPTKAKKKKSSAGDEENEDSQDIVDGEEKKGKRKAKDKKNNNKSILSFFSKK